VLGINLTANLEDRINHWLHSNSQEKFGKHVYKLEVPLARVGTLSTYSVTTHTRQKFKDLNTYSYFSSSLLPPSSLKDFGMTENDVRRELAEYFNYLGDLGISG
tara:strand:+ start:379 stop:690 length:312 start_codon:yes stop_codon:yes gene_type:complete